MIKRMLNSIKRFFTENIGLKLLSVVIAALTWIVVVNVQNPQTTVTFSAVATITNGDIITEKNQVYEVKDNSDLIKFEVTGPRTIVKGLTATDFSVIADMNNFIWNNGVVAVSVTPLRYKNDVTVKIVNPNIKIEVEELVTKQFAVNTATNGKPKTGYAEGELSCYPGTVTITGPESLMNEIEKVVATIDIEGMYDDRTQSIRPTLYNASGDRIESKNITIEPSVVEVTAVILETKTVPVIIDYFGELPEGYALDALSVLPSTVKIKGKRSVLAAIDKIEIPTEILDLSNKTDTYELPIDITNYLPEGVYLVDPDQASCIIRAEVGKKVSKTIEIPVSYISVINLGEGYRLDYNQTTFIVTVQGSEHTVSTLDSSHFTLILDLSGYSPGSYRVKPDIRNISGVTVIDVTYVNVDIVDESTGGDNGE